MMDYASFVSTTWRDHILHSVLLELTYRCSLDCFFCYNDRARRGRLLSLDQYRTLLDELAEMNVLHLALSGGEPLAHPDFWEIARYARGKGFVVRIKSSGQSIGQRVARRLKKEVAPFVVELSLHGASTATYEQQTRVEGSFLRLMRSVPILLDAGLRVQFNTVLTSWNESEIEALYALADRFGVPLYVDPRVTPRDDSDLEPLSIAVTEDGLRRLRLVQQSSVSVSVPGGADAPASQCGDKYCGAGSNGLAVDPYGWVYPCVQWRVPVGSLHSLSIKEIWEQSDALKRVRSLNAEVNGIVRRRPANEVLAFCPGAAERETGSALPPAPTSPGAEWDGCQRGPGGACGPVAGRLAADFEGVG